MFSELPEIQPHHFDEFYKFIKEYKLDISNPDKKKIFKSFDKDNSKTIDDDELVEGLIGSVNLFRAKIVEKIFEKSDEEKKEKISFDTISKWTL